jgi:hypothetical protein
MKPFRVVIMATLMPLHFLTGMELPNPIFPDTPINQHTEPDLRYPGGNGFGDFKNTRAYAQSDHDPGLPDIAIVSSYYFGMNPPHCIVKQIPDAQDKEILNKLGIQDPVDKLYFVIQSIDQEDLAEGQNSTQDLAIKPQAQIFSIPEIQGIYDKAKALNPDTAISKNVEIHLKPLIGSPLKEISYPLQGVSIHIDRATTDEAYPFFSANTHHILKEDNTPLERKDLLSQSYSVALDTKCDSKRYVQIVHLMDKQMYLNEFLTAGSELKHVNWRDLYNHIIGSSEPKLQELKNLVTTIVTP